MVDPKFNCQYPAQEFIIELVKTYGEGIIKAIVEGYDSRYMRDLEEILQKNSLSHS
jgi:hypothetical protein